MIINLPWQGKDVPCAILDIIRGCNAACKFCYNQDHPEKKNIGDILNELDTFCRLRHLQAVMVSGGEPLLHPDVLQVISTVKSRGLTAILLTNAILLDDAMASSLKAAGCDLCYLHIQAGQKRPDISDVQDRTQAVELLRQKSELLLRHGIRAGCCITLEASDELGIERECSTYFDIQALSNILITTARDPQDMYKNYCDDMPIGTLLERFNRAGLQPFASLSGKIDKKQRRWFSFQAVEARDKNGKLLKRICLHASYGELLAMKLQRLFKGHYDFTLPPMSSSFLRARLFLNALTGGSFTSAMKLALMPGAQLVFRNLALDVPPYRRRDGRIEYCEDCPGAILKNGRLRPLCLSDIALQDEDEPK